MKQYNALTTNTRYKYSELYQNIHNYANLLLEYKNYGINRIAVVCKKGIDFDTVCLISALIKIGITPVIINEDIKEKINGILSQEHISIVFYENLKKPKCLKKCNVIIDTENNYFVDIKPYINVRRKIKITTLKWYLNYLGNQKSSYICKMYDQKENGIIESYITHEYLEEYSNSFREIDNYDKEYSVYTTLPLYSKAGFLFFASAIFNTMHLVSLDSNLTFKNINKIIKNKPSIITIDDNFVLAFLANSKLYEIDLSFLKKVVVDVSDEFESVVPDILSKLKFSGSYIVLKETGKQIINEKV